MTNNEIIRRTSEQLVAEGILGTVIIDGVEVPEPIHTFAAWKSLGYSVKKGEKSRIKFNIWKHATKTVEVTDNDGNATEEQAGSMFMKMSAFFTFSQVEPLKA